MSVSSEHLTFAIPLLLESGTAQTVRQLSLLQTWSSHPDGISVGADERPARTVEVHDESQGLLRRGQSVGEFPPTPRKF